MSWGGGGRELCNTVSMDIILLIEGPEESCFAYFNLIDASPLRESGELNANKLDLCVNTQSSREFVDNHPTHMHTIPLSTQWG